MVKAPTIETPKMSMTNSEDKILTRELCMIGGIGWPGGNHVAHFTDSFLATETFNASFRVKAGVRTVLQTSFKILASIGKISDQCTNSSGPGQLSAVVGSGFLRMNPTLVHVQVVPADERTSHVTITAVAKEGLLKQHAAAKAAARFRGKLLRTHA